MNTELIQIIRNGGVAVIPTDTIYGIVASALNTESIDRVYDLKGRDQDKKPIILISDVAEMKEFGVPDEYSEKVNLYKTDSPTSFIVPITRADLYALDRGTGSMAFRIPQNSALRELLAETGPLIAPSANPQGKEPAKTIEEARAYFGETVDIYVDGGYRNAAPSALIDVRTGERLR